jgi:hypothetical protein
MPTDDFCRAYFNASSERSIHKQRRSKFRSNGDDDTQFLWDFDSMDCFRECCELWGPCDTALAGLILAK